MTRATSCLAAWKCRRPVTTIGRLFTYLHECTHMRLRIGIPNRDGVWAPWNGSSKGGEAMRVSRWTIGRWKAQGYEFEFGRRTTAGHLKAWLRGRAAAEPFQGPEQKRLQGVLDRLR
jgi:hypothetical protein